MRSVERGSGGICPVTALSTLVLLPRH